MPSPLPFTRTHRPDGGHRGDGQCWAYRAHRAHGTNGACRLGRVGDGANRSDGRGGRYWSGGAYRSDGRSGPGGACRSCGRRRAHGAHRADRTRGFGIGINRAYRTNGRGRPDGACRWARPDGSHRGNRGFGPDWTRRRPAAKPIRAVCQRGRCGGRGRELGVAVSDYSGGTGGS